MNVRALMIARAILETVPESLLTEKNAKKIAPMIKREPKSSIMSPIHRRTAE